MKSRAWLIVMAVVVVAAPVLTWNAASGVEKGEMDDETAIRTAVGNYYRGVISANRNLIELAWDVENGDMKHVLTRGPVERVGVVPVRKAIDWWTRTAASSSSSRVLDLDIVEGRMALVKYEFIFNKLFYIEYLTLLKVEGKWKIVSKTYVSKKLGE